jgi:hypothetical protein
MKASSVLLTLALVAFGCGHRGPPTPPLPHLPERPQEVHWRQRGDELQLEARYTLRIVGGGALRPPARPEILLTTSSAGTGSSWTASNRDREFRRVAKPLALPPFPADAASPAARRDAVPLATLPEAPELVLALTLADERARSLASPRVVLAPLRPALPAMTTLTAETRENGIELRWAAPEDARAETVRIYRWSPPAGEPWEPFRTVAAKEGLFLDEGPRYGETIVYLVAFARSGAQGTVEGLPQQLAPIDYQDRFPPAPPRDLDAVAEAGRIRVLWYPGGAPDERTWIVERQREGESEFVERGRSEAPDAFFLDDAVEPGMRYRYRVLAQDASGNGSTPVGPTDWVAARPAAESAR